MVDDLVTVECTATARGLDGQTVPIVLRRADQSTVLARTEIVALADGPPQPVRLSWRPRAPGRVAYTIAAEPPKGDPPYGFNRLAGAIDVRKEKISVLLAAGSAELRVSIPRATCCAGEDGRREDRAPGRRSRAGRARPGGPARLSLAREELFAFDVVILDDANPALLGPEALADLSEFVRRPGKGGALVVIAGPAHLPAAVARHALGPAAADRGRVGPAPAPGRTAYRGFRRAADRPGAGQSRHATGRQPGRNQPHLAAVCRRSIGCWRRRS